MTATDNKAYAPLWLAESFRLTAFVLPSANVNGEGWWVSTVGGQPESQTSRPSRGELIEVGDFRGNALTVTVQPGRIDWLLAPNQAQLEDFEILLKTVGPFSEVVDYFTSAMKAWLEKCPPITRLAYGTILLAKVDNKEAGYQLLSKYLPTMSIDPSSQDFFFQINRPRSLPKIKEELIANRLSKWSVLAAMPMRMAISMGSPPVAGPATVYSQPEATVHALRLELDVSTPANRQNELIHDELPTMFEQLVKFGAEIADRGDIR